MNDQEAYDKYVDLIRSIAYNLYKKNSVYSLEDLIQIGSMSIIKTYKKFDPTRSNSMSTLIFISAKREMLQFMMKNGSSKYASKKLKQISSKRDNFWEYLPSLTNEELEIISMAAEGFSQKEIAKNLNTEPYTISKKMSKIQQRIKKTNEEKNTIPN
jgi:RNA polymerase sigma factor (sigma-70 family)